MSTDAPFHFEVEASNDSAGYITTTLICHGQLISQYTPKLREAVQPLIAAGGKIVLDLSDVDYLDSSGLGALVGLKVSAINRGLCVLELEHLGPRVKKLLSITNLLSLFGQEAA